MRSCPRAAERAPEDTGRWSTPPAASLTATTGRRRAAPDPQERPAPFRKARRHDMPGRDQRLPALCHEAHGLRRSLHGSARRYSHRADGSARPAALRINSADAKPDRDGSPQAGLVAGQGCAQATVVRSVSPRWAYRKKHKQALDYRRRTCNKYARIYARILGRVHASGCGPASGQGTKPSKLRLTWATFL